MPKYLLRRFAEMLITLFLIATATFFLLEAVPGDPLTERASKLSPTVKENLYKRYGLAQSGWAAGICLPRRHHCTQLSFVPYPLYPPRPVL